MKIFHLGKFLPVYTGGIESVTRHMIHAGSTIKGWVVKTAAVESKNKRAVFDLPPDSLHPLKNFGELGPISLASGYFKLGKELKGSTIVHVHLPNPMAEMALLLSLSFRKKRPIIIPVLHAGIFGYRPLNWIWMLIIHRQIFRLSDSIIVAAPQIMDSIPFCKEFEKKMRFMPFPSESPKTISKRQPEVKPKKGFNILFIGRLVDYKGLNYLLEALAKINDSWYLTVCGDGPNLSRWLKLSEKLNIADRISFVGEISEVEMESFFQNTDLVVLPSVTNSESYGMVIVEAFAHSKAVIASDLPTGVQYLARNGACGGLVKPRSVDQLNREIVLLMNDPKHRIKAERDNFAFWQENLTIDKFSKNYCDFLKSVVNLSEH